MRYAFSLDNEGYLPGSQDFIFIGSLMLLTFAASYRAGKIRAEISRERVCSSTNYSVDSRVCE